MGFEPEELQFLGVYRASADVFLDRLASDWTALLLFKAGYLLALLLLSNVRYNLLLGIWGLGRTKRTSGDPAARKRKEGKTATARCRGGDASRRKWWWRRPVAEEGDAAGSSRSSRRRRGETGDASRSVWIRFRRGKEGFNFLYCRIGYRRITGKVQTNLVTASDPRSNPITLQTHETNTSPDEETNVYTAHSSTARKAGVFREKKQ